MQGAPGQQQQSAGEQQQQQQGVGWVGGVCWTDSAVFGSRLHATFGVPLQATDTGQQKQQQYAQAAMESTVTGG